MFITISSLIIIAVVLLLLILLIAGMVHMFTQNKILLALSQAAQDGSNFKLNGRAHKIIPAMQYINLCIRAEKATDPVWNWATANGKQR